MALVSGTFVAKWISLIWMISIVHQVSSTDVNITKCFSECQLKVANELRTYRKFIRVIAHKASRVIYFDLYNGRENLYNKSKNIIYAWVRKGDGKSIFSLSSNYMSSTLGLPSVFTQNFTINLNETKPGCYNALPLQCRRHLIFTALTKFIRLPSLCPPKSICGTICRRNYSAEIGANPTTVIYSCCNEDDIEFVVDINKCLVREPIDWYVPYMQMLTIIISIPISVAFMVKCINGYMDSRGKTTTENSQKIRILNSLQFHAIGYFYLRKLDEKSRCKQLGYCFKLILLALIAFAGAILSVTFQIFPAYFQFHPRIYDIKIPRKIYFGVSIVGYCYALLTTIVVLPHLKQFCCVNSPIRSKQSQDKSFKCFTGNSHRQLHFQFTNYMKDAIAYWRSGSSISFIQTCFSIFICLPFVILARIEIIRIVLFITDILSLNMANNLLPTTSRATPTYRLISTLFAIAALMYSVLTIFGIWLFLQFVVKVIITSTAFIIAHSVYFSVVIILVVPYVFYVIRIIDAYRRKEHMIPQKVLRLKEVVTKKAREVYTAKSGTLHVYFKLSRNSKDENIAIDVPEMLSEQTIRQQICENLQELIKANHRTLVDGVSKITFQYERQEDKVKVTLPQLNQDYLTKSCNLQLSQLTDSIGEHLKNLTEEEFCSKLTQIYYPIENIDDFPCVGIPLELFYYLRYYAPEISLNLWRVFLNVSITTGIFLTFCLTILLDSNLPTIFTISAAAANIPSVYITTTLSLKYLTISEVAGPTADMILLTNILQYHRGYRFFCTRGIEFQPFEQLKRILFSYRNRQNERAEAINYNSQPRDGLLYRV
ncbi:hypothetical protein TrispH2_011857 [Trichoplax sp. H2]|nr:hypothetical protein TrispH2_011857 [Trichoplax sp. H2]|eukprot:RDD36220.1 hypothetical protein TrispH2_011857 [Trichoplax sp. H2]